VISPKHIIFDFDGVLADSLKIAIDEYTRIALHDFPSLPLINSQAELTAIWRGSLATCFRSWMTDAESRSFWELHRQAMLARSSEVRVFDGITNLLTSLAPASWSVVTSTYSTIVSQTLNKHGVGIVVRAYRIVGRESAFGKSEMLLGLISDLQLSASEVVYVGDLENDYLACREVGIPMVGAGYGYHSAEYLRSIGVDPVLESSTALLDYARDHWMTERQ
jgi:phosphoglycolate phosphatase